MIKIEDVANWFLKNHRKNITNSTLQILCYYTYAHYLAINDVKLFEAEFQAWVHCPTCVKLKNNTILDDSYVVLGIKNADEIVDENIISFLQQVISTYDKKIFFRK